MGNDDLGHTIEREDRIQNAGSGLAVEGSCGFIDKQDARAAEQASRNRDALFFSSREKRAILAAEIILALFGDKLGKPRKRYRAVNFFIGKFGEHGDVFADRGMADCNNAGFSVESLKN